MWSFENESPNEDISLSVSFEILGLGGISSEHSSGMREEIGELVIPNSMASIHLRISDTVPARRTICLNPAGLQHNPETSCIKSTGLSASDLRSDFFGTAITSTMNDVGPSDGTSLALITVPYPCIVLNPLPQNKCVSKSIK